MMFKTLVKKQMMEVNTWLLQNKKTGKNRSKKAMAGYVLLYVFLFGIVGVVFFLMADMLCEPLHGMGFDWLYYAMMSLISVVMGVFGSIFNAYSTLYEAKDNELLLSMPIQPTYILFARLLGVYLWSAIYTALVFVPAMIVYCLSSEFSIPTLVCDVVLLILLTMFVLGLSCSLGWVVAKISVKLKNRSFIKVLAALVFVAVYYLFYFRAMELIKEFLANAQSIGSTIRGSAMPLYWLGKAGTGNFLCLLLIAAVVTAMIAAIFFVMSRSFIRMATTNQGAEKKVYQREKVACKSVDAALLGKELGRFTSSANYMMNCSLGTIFLPILGVAALIKMDWVRSFIAESGIPDRLLLLILCAGMCMLAAFNDITSPSVSLEGKNLWLVQSLPVHPWQVLKAKLKLHLYVTEIPVAFCGICLCIAAKQSLFNSVICIVLPMVFAAVMAAVGLAVNLKLPNLTWTNEILPIKQSASVTIALFGGWALVLLLGGLYLILRNYVGEYIYLCICGVLLLAVWGGLLLWLKNKGSRIFVKL